MEDGGTEASVRQRIATRLRRQPPSLYALLDDSLLDASEFSVEAQRLVDAGVEVLQVRCKRLGDEEILEVVERVLPIARTAGVPLILNDRCDLVLVSGADGVHVGAADLPAEQARLLLGSEAIVGATAHDLDELAALDPAIVDYVGYGAVFATETRAGATICGPEALTAAAAASSLPIVAIGGITPANVQDLRGSGLAAVAVASSVSPGRACPGAVEELVAALRGW